jgi:hypothetical protein
MPQLHFYVPDNIAAELRARAKSRGLSVSKYVAEIVQRSIHPSWPEGYFLDVVGGWQGAPLERARQGELEEREPL